MLILEDTNALLGIRRGNHLQGDQEGRRRIQSSGYVECGMWMGHLMEMSIRQLDYKAGAGHGNMDLGVTHRDELSEPKRKYVLKNQRTESRKGHI